MDTTNIQGQEMMKAIVAEWGLESFPPEQQMEMVDKIGDLVYQAILLKAVDMLEEKDEAEFDALVEAPGTDAPKVLEFFAKKIPDFDTLVEKEVKNVKAQTVDLIS